MIKGLLILPEKAPEVVEIEEDYREVKRLLGIDSPVDCVTRCVDGEFFDFWVDDEGLYKEEPVIVGCCSDCNEFIVGGMFICQSTDDGHMKSLDDDQILKLMMELRADDKTHSGNYRTFGKIKIVAGSPILLYKVRNDNLFYVTK